MTIKGIKKDKVIVKQFNSEVGSSIYRHEFIMDGGEETIVFYSTREAPYESPFSGDDFEGQNKYGIWMPNFTAPTIVQMLYSNQEIDYDGNYYIIVKYYDKDAQTYSKLVLNADKSFEEDRVTEVPYPFM